MQLERTVIVEDEQYRQRGATGNLLLIGSEGAFQSDVTRRFVGGDRFQIVGSSKSLLDGLTRIESGSIDFVLLSDEFREEELALFTCDAYRRGFTGLILRVASLPSTSTGLAVGTHRELTLGHAESRQFTNFTRGACVAPGLPRLTRRQQTVVVRVADGWSNREIARELQCSESSVKSILQQLFRKCGVRRRSQIVRLAIEGVPAGPRSTQPPAIVPEAVPMKRNESLPANPGLTDATTAAIGDFVVDVAEHRAWVRGMEAKLTPLELKLLAFFTQHPLELLSHQDLMDALWGKQPASRNSLRVLIQSVRRKIENTTRPRYILTLPYYGYRFVPS